MTGTVNGAWRIQRALADQQGRLNSARATYGRERKVTGTLLIEGIGRTGVDLVFPVLFINQPIMLCGQNLDLNENYDVALKPSAEGIVTRWVTLERGGPNNLLWTGCRLLITTTGRPNQRQMLTWQLTGLAIDGIANQLGTTSDPL